MSEEVKDNQEEVLDNIEQASTSEIETTEKESERTDNQSEEVSVEEQLFRLQDTHLRLMAEYDNYRKRTLKEKSELIRNGGEKVLRELLPVIDDLDIALLNMDKAEDIDSLREGMRLIHSKFMSYLQKQGVEVVSTADAPFDEELHEAIATFPAPTEEMKGKVIDCIKKGYTLGDKVIRHASVVVGQ